MTVRPTFDLLSPACRDHMIEQAFSVLPFRLAPTEAERESLRDDALRILARLDPGTPVEAMLAVQTVAVFFAGLDTYARAMEAGIEPRHATRCQKQADSLLRMMAESIKTMMQHRRLQPPRSAAGAAPQEHQQPPAETTTDPAAPAGASPHPKPRLRIVGGRDA